MVDANLRTASDATQFAYAQSTGRVIFTHDEDFLALASQSKQHTGIVFCKLQARSIGQIIQSLDLIWEVLDASEMNNNIEYL